MIILYVGRRGAGKTLTMTKDAYKYYLNGWRILHNYSLDFGELIETSDIFKLFKDDKIINCVLVLDEIQVYFNSRDSQTKENKNFQYFIQQIRKRNIILLCTTQKQRRVDVTIREHVDIICKPRIIEKYGVVECKYYDETMKEDILFEDESELPLIDIVYTASDIYGLFDTTTIIKPIDRIKEKEKEKQKAL